MIDLIPLQYRLIASVIALAVALALAAAGGWFVNGWRLDGQHQRAMSDKQSDLVAEQGKVREQNHAVDLMAKSTEAADLRRKQAERFAADAIRRIDSRSESVSKSDATNCDGVLREAWEKWK